MSFTDASSAPLATAQSGYFTAAQALEVGYSYPARKFHVDHGNWERVDRGIFRLPEWPPSTADSLIRWSLWARGKGVVSHDSALSAHEIGDANPAEVHLTVPPNFRATANGVRLHRGVLLRTISLDARGSASPRPSGHSSTLLRAMSTPVSWPSRSATPSKPALSPAVSCSAEPTPSGTTPPSASSGRSPPSRP